MTRIQDCHIVVIGDVMLDTFVDGSVDRISPEAPIPVLRHQNTRHMPGGASNVARNLAHLGAQVTLIGITGHDGPREMLIDCLAAEPAITPHLIADPTQPTTTKTRFTAKGHQLLRVDDENINPVSADSMTQMASAILSALDTANMVILSDYDKGVIQPNLITLLTNHPRRADFTILADPKQPDIRIYDGVDILTPNLSEFDYFCQYQNITIPQKRDTGASDINAVDHTAQELLGLTSIGAMITTMSADGILISQKNTPLFHSQSMARALFDVSGAGDTVIAHFAATISAGANITEAAILANIAAGIVVGKSGTATVTPGEVLASIHQQQPHNMQSIIPLITEWKNNNERIVFTNGCFDCLHPGHIWLLQAARDKGDRLIVGLNSDASTKRLKGDNRPYQNEMSRASAIAAIPCVDAVILFEEDTPLNLITRLNPDILVKGGDYQADEIVGADHMKAIGGEIQIIALRDGYSTTRLNQQ
jgi:D-beta-D-heptose 7-phosphate kinase/D-beta-D-heptose 1-phosphate adenosyltransferase